MDNSLFVTSDAIKRRRRAEARFRSYGIIAILLGLLMLAYLAGTIISRGMGAFSQSFISLEVSLDEKIVDPKGNRDPEEMKKVIGFSYAPLLGEGVERLVAKLGVKTSVKKAEMAKMLSAGAPAQLRGRVLDDPEIVGQSEEFTFLLNSSIDGYLKGRVDRDIAERSKHVSPEGLDLVDALKEAGVIEKRFNLDFITGIDASDKRAEAAGFGASVMGSAAMMLVVLAFAVPFGVGAALYLEEFAPKNRLTDIIEVNIANLAAVPSIVFGILGLAIFIGDFGLPQSAPLVGGLVLSLITLPRIIIPTRAALGAVPPSIRDAAYGIGASKTQTVFHHVLPLATPGILTGVIIGLAQALGESAPLLLIGMVGFIATSHADSIDAFFLSPNSAMPAQIYEWAKRADPAFQERAWGGIIILLLFLVVMNALAIFVRRKFERRW